MEKIRAKIKICLATALSASMLFSQAAMAAPVDELNEVLEKQQELKGESMMAKTLGLEELGKAFVENGMQVQARVGLTDGTLETLGLTGEIPEDGYGMLNIQVDQNLKKWLLEAGIGAGEEGLLDIGMYGDADLLAISIPQFYSGAVAIGGGSFLEQYNGSVIQQYAGVDVVIPDFDLTFFPDLSEMEAGGPAAELNAVMEEKMQEMQDALQVDKTEESSQIRYTAHYPTEDMVDIYKAVLDSYLSWFQDAGLVSDMEMEETQEELDEILVQMAELVGDEVAVDYYVQDGYLAMISCEMEIDTVLLEEAENVDDGAADYEDVYTDDAAMDYEDEYIDDVTDYADEYTDESIVDFETSYDTNPFVGTLKYECTFAEPTQPWKEFEIKMQVEEQETGQSVIVQIDKKTTESETTSQTTVNLDVWENGESLYSDTLFCSYYDAVTGDLDADLMFKDTDTDTEVVLHLDSVISKMETGFVWTIDALELQAEGQAAGVCAEISVSSEPGEIAEPENPRMIFELDQGGLMGLLMEISVNAENWAAQFEAEDEYYGDIEIYDDDYYSDMDSGEYEDIVVEEAGDESASVSIIGGADGPTSVYVAGKVG